MDLARLDNGAAIVRQHAAKVDEFVAAYSTLLSRRESKAIRLEKLKEKIPRSIKFEPSLISSKESEAMFPGRVAELRTAFNAANGTNMDEMKRAIVAMTEIEIETYDARINASKTEAIETFTEIYYLTHKDLVAANAFVITREGAYNNSIAVSTTLDMDDEYEPPVTYVFDAKESFLEHANNKRAIAFMESTAITYYRTLVAYIESKFMEAFFLHRLKSNAAAAERRARAVVENAAETAELTASRPEMIQDVIERLVNERLEKATKRLEKLERRNVSQSPSTRQASSKKNGKSSETRANSPAPQQRLSRPTNGTRISTQRNPTTQQARGTKNTNQPRQDRQPNRGTQRSSQQSQKPNSGQNQVPSIPYFPITAPTQYGPLPPQSAQHGPNQPRVHFEDDYRLGRPPPTRFGSYLDAARYGTPEGELSPYSSVRRPFRNQRRGRDRSRTRSPG